MPGKPGALSSQIRADYSAASLTFLKKRALTFTEAGLAANMRSTLVKGSIPLRAFLAGTCSAVTFTVGHSDRYTWASDLSSFFAS